MATSIRHVPNRGNSSARSAASLLAGRTYQRSLAKILMLPMLWAAIVLSGARPAAISAAADVSFIAFGDEGTGSSGQLALRDRMVSDAANYDFALLLGDNAYPSGSYADFTNKVFGVYGGLFQGQGQALPAPTSGMPKPAFGSPGNHEYEIDKSAAGYFDSFVLPENGPAGVPPEKYYSFDVGGVHFISFDSHYVVGWDMTTTQAQKDAVRAWLTADLDAHVNQVTVVYDHHPAYTAGPHRSESEATAMRSTWFPVLASHGADVLLSGHDHSYQRNTPQAGLTSYVVGTGGAGLSTVTPQSYTAAYLSDYAYLKVAVSGCAITTSAVRTTGEAYDPWTFTAPTCSTGPGSGQLFADGFETGDYSAWSTVQVGPSGTATVQSSTVRSGAFAASLSATTTAGSYAYARKQLPSAQLNLTAAGDFRILTEGASGANVPLIRLYNDVGTRVLSLYRQNASGSKLYVQHSGLYNTTTGVLPLDTWGNLVVKVRVAGTSSSVEVRLNGTLIHQSSSASLGTGGIFRVQIGNDTTSQAFSLVADNITVDDGSVPNPTPSPSGSAGASASPSAPPSVAPSASAPPPPSVGPSAPPSAAPSAVPSSPPGGILIDDGFESGSLAAWTVRTGSGGVAVIQSTTVRTGVRALRLAATTAGGSYSYVRQSLGGSRPAVAVEANVRLAAEGAAGGNVPIFRLFDAAGTRVLNVYRQNANQDRVYVVFGGITYQTTGRLPLATWSTIGVRGVVNGTAGTVEVWINGTTVFRSTAANLGTSGLATLQLGNDTKRQAFDLAIDDVIARSE